MKTAFIFIFLILGCLAFTGCKSKQLPGEKTERLIYQTETVKDTVLVVEKDSSFYSAYIECINGKPVLKEISNSEKAKSLPKNKAGKHLAIPNVKLQNGVLSVDCQKEAENLFFHWKEKFRKEYELTHKPVPVPVPLTKWQEAKMVIGSLVIWAVGLVALAYLIRFLIRRKIF
jgi:hypothetical protein